MKEYKGSLKCVLDMVSSEGFIQSINTIINPFGALINDNDKWMPKGYEDDKEAELKDFLSDYIKGNLGKEIESWWLAVPSKNSRTPHWDLASTCQINDQKGLLLVEAKAHWSEMTKAHKGKPFREGASKNSEKNHLQIEKAINEAKQDINSRGENISISRDTCYQLSNRIAHAWWLAKHNIPVILLYLGYLNVDDMHNGKNVLFNKAADWESCFVNHAWHVGVDTIINKWVNCGDSSFITIYHAMGYKF